MTEPLRADLSGTVARQRPGNPLCVLLWRESDHVEQEASQADSHPHKFRPLHPEQCIVKQHPALIKPIAVNHTTKEVAEATLCAASGVVGLASGVVGLAIDARDDESERSCCAVGSKLVETVPTKG